MRRFLDPTGFLGGSLHEEHEGNSSSLTRLCLLTKKMPERRAKFATRATLGGFIIFLLKREESKVHHIDDSLREKRVSALTSGQEIPDSWSTRIPQFELTRRQ